MRHRIIFANLLNLALGSLLTYIFLWNDIKDGKIESLALVFCVAILFTFTLHRILSYKKRTSLRQVLLSCILTFCFGLMFLIIKFTIVIIYAGVSTLTADVLTVLVFSITPMVLLTPLWIIIGMVNYFILKPPKQLKYL